MVQMESTLRDLVIRYHQAGYFPSAAVRVFNETETLAEVYVGEAKKDSLFDVASLTKIATATQVLQLISENVVSLDDEISQYFVEIRQSSWLEERFRGITVRRLLTHTSSLPAWYPFYAWQGEDFWTVLQSALRNQLPTAGTVYSDINFILLGKLVERKRGVPLKQCLKIYLTAPLGVENEMLYLPAVSDSSQIIPSCYDNRIEERMCADRGIRFERWRRHGTAVIGTVNDGNCHYYFHDVSGHAGIFATAGAYEKLCQLYMNTKNELLIDAQKTQPGCQDRGLGFETGTAYPHGCGHNGFTGTSIYFSKEYNIGAVAMTNRLFYPEPSNRGMGEFRRALHEMAFSVALAMRR